MKPNPPTNLRVEKANDSYPTKPHRIHGTGIFTYMNGWFLWDQCRHTGVSKKGGKPPKWMVKIMENPIKMDDLGGPTPIFGNTHIPYMDPMGTWRDVRFLEPPTFRLAFPNLGFLMVWSPLKLNQTVLFFCFINIQMCINVIYTYIYHIYIYISYKYSIIYISYNHIYI